jgi:hypothetical protein
MINTTVQAVPGLDLDLVLFTGSGSTVYLVYLQDTDLDLVLLAGSVSRSGLIAVSGSRSGLVCWIRI